jgi:hypothetical protein
MRRPVLLAVSVDTEEDNWEPVRVGLTVENVRRLPRLASVLAPLGLKPTFFVTHGVACTPWALETVRQVAAELGGEVGAHLHPWNTPPFDDRTPANDTMLNNYPRACQVAKLEVLTRRLSQGLGARPTVFRAGRFGLGPETVSALLECEYRVDSSVTPFFSWRRYDNGPDFVGAPVHVYRLDGADDVRQPARDGIIEVPISAGYTRLAASHWFQLARLFARRGSRRVHLAGIGARLGLVRRVILSPETNSVRDLLLLSRRLLEHEVEHLHLFFHSSSLTPGLTPFARDERGVQAIYRSIVAFVERLRDLADVTTATISEVARGAQAR